MNPETTSVTGVLVTGKTHKRFPLAKRAVEAWLHQDYPGPRQLLVINDHPTHHLYKQNELPEFVHECRVKVSDGRRHTLGGLRNIAIGLAQGDYLVQWDDDDYSHRERLRWQVERTDQDCASIFLWEVHCNLLSGQAFANNGQEIRCHGFPGTMLWPKASPVRFRPIGKAEDTEFLLEMRKQIGLKVLDNPPELYFRCYHGHNTWDEAFVMKRKRGSRDLTEEEQQYVTQLLAGPYADVVEGLRAQADGS